MYLAAAYSALSSQTLLTLAYTCRKASLMTVVDGSNGTQSFACYAGWCDWHSEDMDKTWITGRNVVVCPCLQCAHENAQTMFSALVWEL